MEIDVGSTRIFFCPICDVDTRIVLEQKGRNVWNNVHNCTRSDC